MTRKRCIKLLMAQGYDRNEANEIATEAVIAYGSYAKGYEQTLQIKSAIENIDFFALRDVIEKFCTTVSELLPMIQAFAREAGALARGDSEVNNEKG